MKQQIAVTIAAATAVSAKVTCPIEGVERADDNAVSKELRKLVDERREEIRKLKNGEVQLQERPWWHKYVGSAGRYIARLTELEEKHKYGELTNAEADELKRLTDWNPFGDMTVPPADDKSPGAFFERQRKVCVHDMGKWGVGLLKDVGIAVGAAFTDSNRENDFKMFEKKFKDGWQEIRGFDGAISNPEFWQPFAACADAWLFDGEEVKIGALLASLADELPKIIENLDIFEAAGSVINAASSVAVGDLSADALTWGVNIVNFIVQEVQTAEATKKEYESKWKNQVLLPVGTGYHDYPNSDCYDLDLGTLMSPAKWAWHEKDLFVDVVSLEDCWAKCEGDNTCFSTVYKPVEKICHLKRKGCDLRSDTGFHRNVHVRTKRVINVKQDSLQNLCSQLNGVGVNPDCLAKISKQTKKLTADEMPRLYEQIRHVVTEPVEYGNGSNFRLTSRKFTQRLPSQVLTDLLSIIDVDTRVTRFAEIKDWNFAHTEHNFQRLSKEFTKTYTIDQLASALEAGNTWKRKLSKFERYWLTNAQQGLWAGEVCTSFRQWAVAAATDPQAGASLDAKRTTAKYMTALLGGAWNNLGGVGNGGAAAATGAGPDASVTLDTVPGLKALLQARGEQLQSRKEEVERLNKHVDKLTKIIDTQANSTRGIFERSGFSLSTVKTAATSGIAAGAVGLSALGLVFCMAMRLKSRNRKTQASATSLP